MLPSNQPTSSAASGLLWPGQVVGEPPSNGLWQLSQQEAQDLLQGRRAGGGWASVIILRVGMKRHSSQKALTSSLPSVLTVPCRVEVAVISVPIGQGGHGGSEGRVSEVSQQTKS